MLFLGSCTTILETELFMRLPSLLHHFHSRLAPWRWRPFAAITLAMTLLGLASCQQRRVDVELTAGVAHLAQTDPGLVDSLGAYVFVAFFNDVSGVSNSCADLVTRPLSALANEGLVSIQVTDAVDDNAAGRDHIFGRLELPGPHSFLVLGSTKRHTVNGQETGNFPVRRENIEETFDDAAQSVVAVGCVEQTLQYESKFDLDVVLFPVGLR